MRRVPAAVLHGFLAVAFEADRVQGLDAVHPAEGVGGFADHVRRWGLRGGVYHHRG